MTITAFGLAATLALLQYPSAPPATPSPAPSSTPLIAESPLPSPVTPVPLAAPSTPATPATPAALFSAAPGTPDAAATMSPSAFEYRFVPHQPATLTPGEPQIFAVYLNKKRLRSHGPIVIRVETNPAVVKMESKSNGRGGAIPMVAPGVFFAQSTLPGIPFIAAGMSTDLIFTATSADGRTVSVKVPVQLG